MRVLRILDRYVLREVVGQWALVSVVLFVILLTSQLASTLERAAQFQYPRQLLLELLALGAVQNLAIVLPVGLLLGVVLALGRLSHDSELTAALACGAKLWRLYAPLIIFTVLVSAVLALLTLQFAPRAAAQSYSLRDRALQAGQFAPLAAGKFRAFGGSDVIVYVESVQTDGVLQKVFVERSRSARTEVIVAQRATQMRSSDGMTYILTLYDGERFEGTPGSAEFRILRFARQVIPVQLPSAQAGQQREETQTTAQLLQSTRPELRAELHWRFALPIMGLVLALLALPLGQLPPRAGRYSRVWVALLIYVVYANLLAAGKVWLARGTVPQALGLWWVHLSVVALGLLIIYGPRYLARWRHRDVPA